VAWGWVGIANSGITPRDSVAGWRGRMARGRFSFDILPRDSPLHCK
jgi:hypothetical protein